MGRRRMSVAELRALAAEAVERGEPLWVVRLSDPCGRMFCNTSRHELEKLGRVLVGCRIAFEVRRTDRAGIECVTFDELETLAACESMMPGLMDVVRANHLHGSYHKAGTEKEYEF